MCSAYELGKRGGSFPEALKAFDRETRFIRRTDPAPVVTVSGELATMRWGFERPKLGPCFSMMTTRPNTLVEPIHNRMPAVLTDDQLAPNLAGEIKKFDPHLRKCLR